MPITKTNTNNKSELEVQDLTPGFIDPQLVAENWGLKEGDKVADLGCGGGYFTIPVAHIVGENGKVYAIDVMEGPIEAVRSRVYLEKLNNVEVMRANLEKKGSLSKIIKSGECQCVVLANVLYTSKKKKAIVQEARRILADKGKVVVVDWVREVKNVFRNFGPPVELRITEKEARDLLKKEGFVLESDFSAGQFHFGMIFRKKS